MRAHEMEDALTFACFDRRSFLGEAEVVLQLIQCLEEQYQAASEFWTEELSQQLEQRVDGSTPFFIACQVNRQIM